MASYTITKNFDFCYGHRVWSQNLDPKYSLDSCLVCRHLHGHQGSIEVRLKGKTPKDGMVTDFKHLNWFKKWIDNVLDHKMILDKNDPLIPFEVQAEHFDFEGKIPLLDKGYYTTLDMNLLKDFTPQPLVEKYEGIVLVEFVPTSENMAAWMFNVINAEMEEHLKSQAIVLESVMFKETPKTSATYSQ